MPHDLAAILRAELAPPPLDLSPIERQLADVREQLAALARALHPAAERLESMAEVAARVGYGRTKFLELLKEDRTFPRPVDLGGSMAKLLFRSSEVDAWIRSLPHRRGTAA